MAVQVIALIVRDTETGDERRLDIGAVVQEPPAPPADPPEPPQDPEPPPPVVDAGALEASAAFSVSSLNPAQVPWHTSLLGAMRKAYPNPRSAATAPTGKPSADVYMVSRVVNLYVGAIEAALRATRNPALVEEVYQVMELARANMTTRDGHQVWLYWHDDGPHHGTDNRNVDETLLFWLVVRVARLLKANADLNDNEKYRTAGDWWADYALSMLARWQKKNPTVPPLQALDKLLTHCYVSMAGGFLLLGEMTGKQEYTKEGYRRLAVFRQMLHAGPRGGLIWRHDVPGLDYPPQGYPAFDYVSHTVEVLQTLAHEGYLDAAMMQQITAGVRDHMLRSENEMAVNLDGSGQQDGRKYTHNTLAGLGVWDSTGKIASINAALGAKIETSVFVPAYELLRWKA